MFSNLLDKFNVKYEDLNTAERETLSQWYKLLAEKVLTVGNVKEYVEQLIHAVEQELADIKESTSLWSFLFRRKQDIYLKARLKNYLILHDFLTGPDKAKKYIEQSIQNLK